MLNLLHRVSVKNVISMSFLLSKGQRSSGLIKPTHELNAP